MIYLDTSATAKLVVAEAVSAALSDWLDDHVDVPLVTSVVGRIELLRVVQRYEPDRVSQAHDILDQIAIAALTPAICDLAESLRPEAVRTLDAIHLATALDLGGDLTHFVAYDHRL